MGYYQTAYPVYVLLLKRGRGLLAALRVVYRRDSYRYRAAGIGAYDRRKP